MTNDDMQFHLRAREHKMNSLQNKMAAQTRILDPRDDPTAAAHASRYRSVIHRLERFAKNVEYAQANHQITEGRVREAVDILHRVREITIQGANGTYSKDEMKYMGNEVNELLNQLVDIANAKNGEGNTIFSGDKTKSLPFRAVTGSVAGSGSGVITNVEYVGTIGENYTEISDGTYLKLNYPGNKIFWAENQQLFPATDASSYQVGEDTSIYIDGVAINLKEGDTIHGIIAKINDSDAPVRARLDPMRNSLVLETTTPHQLWLRDAPDGRVLQDLGILKDNESPPPHNLQPAARSFGGSMFDMVIKLRDDLFRGDVIEVGGRDIRGIDDALSGVLASLGDIGAQGKRLEFTYARLNTEIPDMKSLNSMTVDLDMTEAITELKMLEYTHKAALSTAGRILQPTLLDFLR
jgi:flagellar hook-associated protein 3 FlgL